MTEKRDYLYAPACYWDEERQCIVVPKGACPYPIAPDDGTVEDCIASGNCGCDARREEAFKREQLGK